MSAGATSDVLEVLARDLMVYSELMHALSPRADGFCFYTSTGQLGWSSTGEKNAEATLTPAQLQVAEPGQFHTVKSASASIVYCTKLLDSENEPQGYFCVDFADDSNNLPGEAMLFNLMRPTLTVFTQSLTQRLRNAVRESDQLRTEKRLGVIYSLDDKVETSPHGQASLAHLVGAVARNLRIGYSVLLMPDKRIRYGVTHPDWQGTDRKVLDKTTIRRLLPSVSGRKSAVLLDVSTVPEGLVKDCESYQIIACPIREGGSRVTGILALFGQVDGTAFNARDLDFANHITRRTERVIELNYDPLTGLMNRSGFESNLREAYNDLDDNGDEHALVFFDLDKMQLFNDTFNHRAGDEVLVRFASELQRCLPKKGVASRLSGDDFAVLLPHSSVEDGVELAEQMRSAAHKMSYLKGDKSHQITVSAGVAPFRVCDEGHAGAMIAPKVACTAAKDHGRDRVEVYDQDNHSIVRRVDDMQIVGQIHNALGSGDFQLVAQPIVALDEAHRKPYYEVLVRMLDSSGAELKPDAFFSAAERYQLMPKLDRWVIGETLRQLAQVPKEILDQKPVFAINLSGQSLQDDALLEFVEEQIRTHKVAAPSICFEITETAAVANMTTAKRFIQTMKSRGCLFSLDDFGAGLSSFAYLKSLDVDTLKIDGSFVKDLTTNKVSEAMVAAITEVAQVMELRTVAEYVENDDVLKKVQAIGVDFAQGYFFGEPKALETVLNELADVPDAQAPAAESLGAA